jgi:hypothetical protein
VADRLFTDLPAVGAWRLLGAYEGHEVVRFSASGGGIVLDGITAGVEEDMAWGIHYVIDLSGDWHVRGATVADHAGTRLDVLTDGGGSWTVDGRRRPELDGCLDLDPEASVVANTIPIHRLALPVDGEGRSAAVYIRSNRWRSSGSTRHTGGSRTQKGTCYSTTGLLVSGITTRC